MLVPETTNAETPPKLLMSRLLLLASCSQIRGSVLYRSIHLCFHCAPQRT
ncbi:hypothetical protein BDA96_06G003300 [Sorghum bicolor]|uniref:Uncharacterized protein n=1 Tax=Sorghum bicolor TaxID=4558 RepID=A0A921UBV5_SORBI|nr:hypothetical protein BDA96_06G003300 [Sorghum bicolor]